LVEIPDAELARQVTQRVAEAEAELYRRLAPRVRLYGLRHLRDEQAANDLMQQVMWMTIESLRAGRVEDPEKLASFVLGTCRQVVLDLRRGQARRERLLERFATEMATAEWQEPPLDLDRLRECLERLSERERSVVVMTFYAERATAEVAAHLGLAAGNVRLIRHRALGRLRGCLEGKAS
jgi:RNA polymerase sigma-70 factor (ECF subfamily)